MNDDKSEATSEARMKMLLDAREEADYRKQAYWRLEQDFDNLLSKLKSAKPDKRSEESRRFAVTITELEKVSAYFSVYIRDAI